MAGISDESGSPLPLIGLHMGDEQLYRTVLRSSGSTRARLTEITGLTEGELDEVVDRFTAAGLVRVEGDVVTAEPPVEAIGAVVAAQSARLRHEGGRVEALRDLLPSLVSEYTATWHPQGDALDAYAVQSADVASLLRGLAEESTGDLLWFRPDQWRLPVTREIDEMVRDLIRSGRRSRAIYPARVLEEAPDIIRARAEAGEQVRIVAEVPSRISVLGSTAAVMSDRWGVSSGRRLVVREESLVGALSALFDALWERAMAVPGLDVGVDLTGQRRLLLHQLTLGAKDEQIARALGVSLRTVRRRIADIMDELGAESRFQAGVEAVRRGWL